MNNSDAASVPRNEDLYDFGLCSDSDAREYLVRNRMSKRARKQRVFDLLLAKDLVGLLAALKQCDPFPKLRKLIADFVRDNDNDSSGDNDSSDRHSAAPRSERSDPFCWFTTFDADAAALFAYTLERASLSYELADISTLQAILLRPDLLFRAGQYECLLRLRNATTDALQYAVDANDNWYVDWRLVKSMQLDALLLLCKHVCGARCDAASSRSVIVVLPGFPSCTDNDSLRLLKEVWRIEDLRCWPLRTTLVPKTAQTTIANMLCGMEQSGDDDAFRTLVHRFTDHVCACLRASVEEYEYAGKFVMLFHERNRIALEYDDKIATMLQRKNGCLDYAATKLRFNQLSAESCSVNHNNVVATGRFLRPKKLMCFRLIAHYAMALAWCVSSDVELQCIVTHLLPCYLQEFIGYFTTMRICALVLRKTIKG